MRSARIVSTPVRRCDTQSHNSKSPRSNSQRVSAHGPKASSFFSKALVQKSSASRSVNNFSNQTRQRDTVSSSTNSRQAKSIQCYMTARLPSSRASPLVQVKRLFAEFVSDQRKPEKTQPGTVAQAQSDILGAQPTPTTQPGVPLTNQASKHTSEPTSSGTEPQLDKMPTPAKVLGYAGLIPFFAGAAGAVILADSSLFWAGQFVFYQMTYATTILSFLGGIHWGLGVAKYHRDGTDKLTSRDQWIRFSLSIIPPLLSWSALVVSPLGGMIQLLVSFSAAFLGDMYAEKKGLVPAWYVRELRLPLTLGAIFSLSCSFLFMM